MTRATYTLAGVNGPLTSEGGLTFKEKDGIDYAATTVQLPGGERVPFMFTVKELVAKSSDSQIKPGTEFSGTFKVPSYRSGLFLDPKGRGAPLATTWLRRSRVWRLTAPRARPSSRVRRTRSSR